MATKKTPAELLETAKAAEAEARGQAETTAALAAADGASADAKKQAEKAAADHKTALEALEKAQAAFDADEQSKLPPYTVAGGVSLAYGNKVLDAGTEVTEGMFPKDDFKALLKAGLIQKNGK